MAIFKIEENLAKKDLQNSTEEEAMADLMRAFPMMVCGDVQTMRMVVNEARGLYEPQRTEYLRSRLLPLALKLKEQGSVFGYPLVTDVASHLYNFLSLQQVNEKRELDIIYGDVLTLQNILWKRISGDGGEEGRRILAQLV